MQNTITQLTEDPGVPVAARDFSVKDIVVIVIGAAQGIGRELARQYAAAGAIPVVADLNIDKAERVVAEIRDDGGTAFGVAVDIGDRESVNEMANAATAKFGRIDALISNAAIFVATLPKRPFDQIHFPNGSR
ncbi:SDR family NAD(P)-dependent oxidoreductase [Variovorax sp. HJSM1_2]|uniref:SDR family NAD(P)-dependent oxidoreductase n=1 Tax=Variovorax sp. HJSM1_2 TaxID=3366263 RepID=UPI003BD89C80